jgi:hypothetical protein
MRTVIPTTRQASRDEYPPSGSAATRLLKDDQRIAVYRASGAKNSR